MVLQEWLTSGEADVHRPITEDAIDQILRLDVLLCLGEELRIDGMLCVACPSGALEVTAGETNEHGWLTRVRSFTLVTDVALNYSQCHCCPFSGRQVRRLTSVVVAGTRRSRPCAPSWMIHQASEQLLRLGRNPLRSS